MTGGVVDVVLALRSSFSVGMVALTMLCCVRISNDSLT